MCAARGDAWSSPEKTRPPDVESPLAASLLPDVMGPSNGCQRTYASVTAPGSSEESAELLIDEADSEEAASPTSAREGAPSTSSSPPPGQPEKHPLAASVREPEDAPARAAVAASARKATAQGHYARIS
ncbi:hypothetical protein HPB52_023709 [Rhipicephalus sanguineus]|uniref:Uncharacterized protein n=1 Tax=Rhipicephalus sanguineus TaxID=34632 RepID=A0A9D4TC87_RHISA|nr:hypothetical protein HPB52_023709 [Rhipicephalus sanguineus]